MWTKNDAYSLIIDIFNRSKKELIIIDSYADKSILDIISNINKNINITIITKDNNLLKELDIKKYNQQYSNLKVIYNNTFHDRFFIIDNKELYHCGASINRIGYKSFAINKINDKEEASIFINRINALLF